MTFESKALPIAPADRRALEAWVSGAAPSPEHALRARIVLESSDGEGARPLARRLGLSPSTVCNWRRRFRERGLPGLETRPRPGRPRQITDEREREIVAMTLEPPRDRSAWSARTLARATGVSHSTIFRTWRKYDVRPATRPRLHKVPGDADRVDARLRETAPPLAQSG